MSYSAIIAELSNVRKHSNADRLQIATVYGNQIIVGLEQKDGDVGIYFPTDGQLSEIFCEYNNLIGKKNPDTGEREGGLFDHKRRVRTQKLRGEKSDGFWIPLKALEFTEYNLSKLKVGEQLTELNGHPICNKYIIHKDRSNPTSNKTLKRKKRSYSMLKEHFDTTQWSYNNHKVNEGDLIIISEKLHGTSGRTGYIRFANLLPRWKERINKIKTFFKETYSWDIITGSRRVVLDDFNDEKKLGFYNTNEFRKKYHDQLKSNLKKGETIYYEIVGYVGDRPIMGTVDNKKTKDKEFIKKYGDTTTFTYGCPLGTNDMYIYRITMTNEDGYTIDYSWSQIVERCKELNVKIVPLLIKPFIFDGNLEVLKQKVEELCEGSSTIDPSHLREGIVVRIEKGLNLFCLKHKSFHFKVLEGIIKDSDVPDIEEQQDIIAEEN